MKLIQPLLVTRGLDPRVHLPLPTLHRNWWRVGRGLDFWVKPGNEAERTSVGRALISRNVVT
jgi:hypothetical protein